MIKNNDEQIRLNAIRIDALYNHSTNPVAVTFTGCAILVFVLWDKEIAIRAISWLALLLLVSSVRYLINIRYHSSKKSLEDYADWLNIFFVGVIFSGTVLGSAAFVFNIGNNIINAGLLTMFILVLVSGSIGIYSVFQRIYFGFTIPAIVPLIIYLLYQQNEQMSSLCTVIIAFVVFIFIIQFHASKIINQLLIIKLNNEQLLEGYELDHEKISELTRLYKNVRELLDSTKTELRICQDKLEQQK